MRESFKAYCIRTNNLEKLNNWHPEKNLPDTPETVSYGSSTRKFWWRCPVGHEWQTDVCSYKVAAHTCPICVKKNILSPTYNLKVCNPEVAAQWNYEKNSGLKPEDCVPQSHKIVWWKCEFGHDWRAIIKSRTHQGTKCPVCAGKIVLPGFNDLATIHPECIKEWHPTKNAPLTPDQVLHGSTRKVWWRCPEGHEWEAVVYSRSRGNGCPVCAGKSVIEGENDLASSYPEIAAQWHPTKNGELTPTSVTPFSNRKVWWICEKKHEYEAAIASRAGRDNGCPICGNHKLLPGFNDLATVSPLIASQWHPTKNGTLTPCDVKASSRNKAWWICEKGHAWQAQITVRVRTTTGCPYCSNHLVLPGFNDLQTYYPELAKEWHPLLNKPLTPDMVVSGNNRRVWWVCSEGHVWKTQIASRTGKGTGCPVCAGYISKKRKTKYDALMREAELLLALQEPALTEETDE